MIYTKSKIKRKRTAKSIADRKLTDEINKKWAIPEGSISGHSRSNYSNYRPLTLPDDRNSDVVIRSRVGGGDTYRRDSQVYTGDKMLGIGTLHKSNAVPIFKEEEARDLAQMRR